MVLRCPAVARYLPVVHHGVLIEGDWLSLEQPTGLEAKVMPNTVLLLTNIYLMLVSVKCYKESKSNTAFD